MGCQGSLLWALQVESLLFSQESLCVCVCVCVCKGGMWRGSVCVVMGLCVCICVSVCVCEGGMWRGSECVGMGWCVCICVYMCVCSPLGYRLSLLLLPLQLLLA